MKNVLIHRLARAELDEGMTHYEQQEPGLGLDLQAEVEQAVATIQRNPALGASYKETAFRYLVLHRFPYVVYYLDLAEVIWIAAIAHGKRRPGYWRRRRLE